MAQDDINMADEDLDMGAPAAPALGSDKTCGDKSRNECGAGLGAGAVPTTPQDIAACKAFSSSNRQAAADAAALAATVGGKTPAVPSASLVVYWGSGSPPAWRVLACLKERNQPYHGELVSFESKILKTEPFLRLNPRGMVPILVDGDTVMYESLAILMYLEFKFPEDTLLPACHLARARALCRMQEANNASSAGGELIYYLRRTPPHAINFEYLEAKRAVLNDEMKLWNSFLADCDYLAGPGQTFSLADIAFFPNLAYLVRLGFEIEKFPQLHAYYKRLAVRPCFASTWPPHWKGTTGSSMLSNFGPEAIELAKAQHQVHCK